MRRFGVGILAMCSLLAVGAGASAANAVYQENGGQLIVEAENFVSNTAQADHEWKVDSAVKGFSGTGYVISLPNAGVNNNPYDPAGGPILTYNIHINKAGTYYAIARMSVDPNGTDAGSDDSIWLSLNDMEPSGRVYCDEQHNGWAWCFGDGGTPVSFDLKPGDYTLKLTMREDGTIADQVGLTTDANFAHDTSAIAASAAK